MLDRVSARSSKDLEARRKSAVAGPVTGLCGVPDTSDVAIERIDFSRFSPMTVGVVRSLASPHNRP
jgi:hypothetical protein